MFQRPFLLLFPISSLEGTFNSSTSETPILLLKENTISIWLRSKSMSTCGTSSILMSGQTYVVASLVWTQLLLCLGLHGIHNLSVTFSNHCPASPREMTFTNGSSASRDTRLEAARKLVKMIIAQEKERETQIQLCKCLKWREALDQFLKILLIGSLVSSRWIKWGQGWSNQRPFFFMKQRQDGTPPLFRLQKPSELGLEVEFSFSDGAMLSTAPESSRRS